MGRSSKFISSEVRLRSSLLRAWTVASIALCTAFVGVDTASAGPVTVSVPITVPKVNVPTVSVPRVNVPTVNVPKVNVPTATIASKVNVPTAIIASKVNVPTVPTNFNVRSKPEGALSPDVKGLARGIAPLNRSNPNGGDATVPGGDATGVGGATASNGGGATASNSSGARYYASGSQDRSITVCGRYPYPACH